MAEYLLTSLRSGRVLADGGIGTSLVERGVSVDACFEVLNADDPDLVAGVHRSFVEAGLELPILAGVLPLAGSRHAEFPDNGAPGMVIPDAVPERLRGASGSAAAEGVSMAVDPCGSCGRRPQGSISCRSSVATTSRRRSSRPRPPRGIPEVADRGGSTTHARCGTISG